MYFLDFQWKGAEGFNTFSSEAKAKFAGMTMKDYLRYLWNEPSKGQSPYKIFAGVLIPDGYDEDKNIVYRYNKSVTFQEQTGGDWELRKL